ncbi:MULTISPECIES: RipA family octameric membrane protein [Streptomyces]|uniref:Uncharacterized protein n=2 Tax=Streptomyces TaxID=1883 RepID=A0A514JLW5_9ACTN|nr:MULTISPECIES: hypothetical protein [Streptomyces]MBA8975573.1 hypothetical protein [Streptomyces calvus]MYS27750.1 hypothetical protein [Streptomyces sp. SID7804]QDI68324.1 hypothetical protein CD934_06295 [Streptomyces calvus]
MSEISESLWNDDIGASAYREEAGSYQSAVLEQYKLYVEMADRVSARRNLANTFFLTLNSALVASLGAWLSGAKRPDLPVPALAAGLLVMLAVCTAWWSTVRSYRQLSRGKFAVIEALEERLPARAFVSAEWKVLGEGRNWRVYLPLVHVERWIPLIFAVAYVFGFTALAL